MEITEITPRFSCYLTKLSSFPIIEILFFSSPLDNQKTLGGGLA